MPHDERASVETGFYMRTVHWAVRRPGLTLSLALLLLIVVQVGYGKFGRGVEFFPAVEPDFGQAIIHARGNISLDEKVRAVLEVEKSVLTLPGMKTVYTRVGEQPRGSGEISEDTIGVIQFEFDDWKTRPPAHELMDRLRHLTADLPGILVEVTAPRAGPPTGKPIQIQISALDPDVLPAVAAKVAAHCPSAPTSAISTTACRCRASTGRSRSTAREAAKYGAGPNTVGTALQLVTNGVKVTEYRPSDSDKAVDILLRFPGDRRSLDRDRRVAHPDPGWPCADRQFRRARTGAACRQHQSRWRQSRHDRVGEPCRWRSGSAGAAGDHRGTCGDGPRDRASAGVSRAKTRNAPRHRRSLLKAFGAAIFLIFAILLAQFNRLTSVMPGAVGRRAVHHRRAARACSSWASRLVSS